MHSKVAVQDPCSSCFWRLSDIVKEYHCDCTSNIKLAKLCTEH